MELKERESAVLPRSLVALLEANPSVRNVFTDKMWSKLSLSESSPFDSDRAYLEAVDTIFFIRSTLEDMRTSLRVAVTAPDLTRVRDQQSVKGTFDLAAAVEDLLSSYTQIVKARLEVNKSKGIHLPRLVRLSERLELTDKEELALGYCVLAYSRQLTCRPANPASMYSHNEGYVFREMCLLCGLTVNEGLHFLGADRLHVKESLLIPDQDDPIDYGMKIPFLTAAVIAGTPLGQSDMLKLDKTLLAEILLQEQSDDHHVLRISAEDISPSSLEEPKQVEGTTKSQEKEDVFDFLRGEIDREGTSESLSDLKEDLSSDLTPYTTNVSYLSDIIEWISTKIRCKNLSREMESDIDRDAKMEVVIREYRAKERMYFAKCEKRLQLTISSGTWLPRMEKLVRHMELNDFEKFVVLCLVANTISHRVDPNISRYRSSSSSVSNFTVGDLLFVYCSDLEEELKNRTFFYKNSKLVREGIVRIEDSWTSELLNSSVDLDRRMLDFIVGLDREFSELVEGSHLYTPQVDLSQVVLPDETKSLITNTAANYTHFVKARKRLGFDDIIQYGSGIVMLFFGKPGTGKTMMANAVAKYLQRRVLLINYPSLGCMSSDLVIKFIFREAKLADAILFFDECESIFMSRDIMSGSVNLLLTEIERHNGLIIMATNRAFDLDEAMHRRITLAVEFKQPDPFMRARIWKAHIPSAAKVSKDVDFEKLALKYELSGGFIKNAVLSALSSAVARDHDDPEITMEDLNMGAVNQLRGRLSMVEFDRRLIPTRGIEQLILDAKTQQRLRQIVSMEKSRQVLFSEWGYCDKTFSDQGTSCLFYGPPGTGKTLAAEAIGFETGKPLKIVNYAEIQSKWVGDTSKHLDALFREARSLDCILVFDDGEGLFASRSCSSSIDRYANQDTSVLLYHMERFPGIVILTTNMLDAVDKALLRRFRFIVGFENPSASMRAKMWQMHLPPRAPLHPDVDFERLGNSYELNGAAIKKCCFKASSIAALRSSDRVIKMEDLTESAQDELILISGEAPPSMYV